jgi:nitrite reductase (NADH) small subunit
MTQRVKIAVRSEIPPGTGKVVVALGRVLALFNLGGSFHAVDNSCPHRGGPLGEGFLNDCVVTCPWHGWQFDVRSGISPLNPSHAVRSVPVEVEGENVFARLD